MVTRVGASTFRTRVWGAHTLPNHRMYRGRFKEIFSAEEPSAKKVTKVPGGRQGAVSKRANKNRPREVSSKRPVPRLRQAVPTKKVVARDPRFDTLSGHLNEDLFEKSYSWLDDKRKQEIEVVRKGKTLTKGARPECVFLSLPRDKDGHLPPHP